MVWIRIHCSYHGHTSDVPDIRSMWCMSGASVLFSIMAASPANIFLSDQIRWMWGFSPDFRSVIWDTVSPPYLSFWERPWPGHYSFSLTRSDWREGFTRYPVKSVFRASGCSGYPVILLRIQCVRPIQHSDCAPAPARPIYLVWPDQIGVSFHQSGDMRIQCVRISGHFIVHPLCPSYLAFWLRPRPGQYRFPLIRSPTKLSYSAILHPLKFI